MIKLFSPKVDTEEVLSRLRHVFESGWIGPGPAVEELEDKMAKYLNVKHFILLNSCTSALHLALVALGVKEGDVVLTTPMTFISTNAVLNYVGACPIFVDVERKTGNIAFNDFYRNAKGSQPKAAIVVHLGGYPVSMDLVNELGSSIGIPIIEDCAHALGSRYDSKRLIGDTNNTCCWSFQAVKTCPMGDGGGISTNDDLIAEKLRKLRWMGIDKTTYDRSGNGYSWEYKVTEVGYNYHSNDILATVGLVGLEGLEIALEHRRNIATRYLYELKGVILPEYLMGLSSYHFLPLFFEKRDKVMSRLDDACIQYGMHYKRNDSYGIFQKQKLRGAEWYEDHELTLPMHLDLSDDDVSRIIDVVNA